MSKVVSCCKHNSYVEFFEKCQTLEKWVHNPRVIPNPMEHRLDSKWCYAVSHLRLGTLIKYMLKKY